MYMYMHFENETMFLQLLFNEKKRFFIEWCDRFECSMHVLRRSALWTNNLWARATLVFKQTRDLFSRASSGKIFFFFPYSTKLNRPLMASPSCCNNRLRRLNIFSQRKLLMCCFLKKHFRVFIWFMSLF